MATRRETDARSGEGRTRTNDPDRTRADILAVAADHFATKGFNGSRVDEIAEQTHTSKRMLYYYFGSKEGLFRAVLARAYDGIRAHEAGIDLDSLPPVQALRQMAEATFDHHRLNPDFVRLVMTENIHLGQNIGSVPGIEGRAESVLGILDALLARGRAAGVFRDGITAIDLHMTMSALAFYNVSNSHTFSRIFRHDMTDPAHVAARRTVVADTICRWVCLTP